jgi:hypothetical protein
VEEMRARGKALEEQYGEDLQLDVQLPPALLCREDEGERDAQGNETAYDYGRCIRIFQEAGYQGGWGIEFEGELPTFAQ